MTQPRLWIIFRDMTIHEVSARQFSENLEREVEGVVSNHEILRVRRDGGNIVVLSADDWHSVEETLYLNKVPGLVDSIHEAAREPLEEGTRVEDFDW